MPNQRSIAQAAGVTQAAVSKALRGDPSIPEKTRQRICIIAKELGYRQNPYVASLMEHIRSGKKPRDLGSMALVSSVKSKEQWLDGSRRTKHSLLHNGIVNRARQRGFRTELFFLGASEMTPLRIESILQARGIRGLIILPPAIDITQVCLKWDQYAVVSLVCTSPSLWIDCIVSHHRLSMNLGYRKLIEHGYRRIGTCLAPKIVNHDGSIWLSGFLLKQNEIPIENRIPLFIGEPRLTPIADFQTWLEEWKPDALVCLTGKEKECLDQLGIALPKDMGMVCVNRIPQSPFSGMEDDYQTRGEVAVDTVATKIRENQYGLAEFPRMISFKAIWNEGMTIRKMPSKGT